MRYFLILVTAFSLGISCKNASENITPTSSAVVPEVYSKIYGATSITNDGTYITIKTTGVPDHKSAYFASTSAQYEAFTGKTFGGNNFAKNPNAISAQSFTFKIPVNPKVDAAHKATPLGPIGVALNGVPLFNQYAGPSQPLTNEVNGFDQYWGHPQQTGSYHYHVEPLYLTQVKLSKSSLLGFLLDGFPVYGPEEGGQIVQNASLDTYHGHSHSTTEYPNGIYHYHITNSDPYINGSGFYGSAGTVSQ
ncbi:YHYH protein [Aquirufa ecclesiirivi]|uniref:YHYH protein n=1 Tax=Aquirufa ecclesiirivi TaxID=2715124 RepID=UPI00140869D0|nr:YHYH protein [Aquirufa ecclesiirivi]NHC48864.1 YHYH protein [Aquirufa ecclesiirivi]